MNDLINKQMTIEECINCDFHIGGACACLSYDKWYACPIENKKPENIQALKKWGDFTSKTENMRNFLDNIDEHLRSVRIGGCHDGDYNRGYDDGLDYAIAALKMLTVRCKDCKNVHFDTTFKEYWCNGKKVPANHFCGYAK